jgi:protoporphyrinogen oxidase
MGKKKIVVLGAGLAGLSAAWHLQKNGVDCSVFEKEPCAGGLCRSRRINGFTFDCDGHLLHFRNKYSRRLISGLLGSRLVAHRRSAWVSSFGTFIRYPFQANLNALPEKVAEECLVEFLKASLPSIREDKSNLLKWINGAFGTGIARHFMIPYNKKFWTVPLSGMSADWTVNFVPRPEPLEVIAGFFGAGRRSFGYNTTFWYPRRRGLTNSPWHSNGVCATYSRILPLNP